MYYRILGSLQVRDGPRTVDVGTAHKPRRMLAALLVSADEPVSVDVLTEVLWPDEVPPRSARRNIHLYVHRLRRALGVDSIAASPAGYAIVTGGRTDADEFGRLSTQAERAHQAGDTERAGALLRQALDLWRGPVLHEFGDCEFITTRARRLDQLRLSAVEHWARIQLAGTPSTQFVTELTELTEAYPYHEGLRADLMRALSRTGRVAEALRLFQHTREVLLDELGVEPGPLLAEAHENILRGDDDRGGLPRPAQLPGDVRGFAGRGAELAALDAILAEPPDGPRTIVISGTAGVGKTSLAVHWAHRVADRFPDGQLYVNLRGFDPANQPMSAEEALRCLLDALAVAPERIPAGPQAKTGLWRSLLAGRRVLIVLDNARDAEQVRPLLPGASGCVAVVTSRDQLGGLIVSDGADPLPLDLLSTAQARELVVHRLGAGQVADDQTAVDDIIGLCARLPLALAVALARATAGPTLRPADLAARLRAERSTLDGLATGDTATDVRSVFSWSYQTLSGPAARLFRLLGLHPGTDLATPAAAALADLPIHSVRPLLTELTRAHLIGQPAPGRYALHDLLREYAAELAGQHDGDTAGQAASGRVLDHYLHTAHMAAMLLYPHRHPITVEHTSMTTSSTLTDHAQALHWFTTEHAVLCAAIEHAVRAGFDTHAWQLAWCLVGYLDRRGHWDEQVSTSRIGLAAASRRSDRGGQAHSHHGLAVAHAWLDDHDAAHRHYDASLSLFADLGDPTGQAHSHLNRALLYERQGRHREALAHSLRSLELFEAAADRSGRAKALNAVGWYQTIEGQPAAALANCGQALDLMRELGDRYGEASTWDSLGYVHHQLTDHRQAVACYRQSVTLWHELGDRHSEASVLNRLGDVHAAAGDAGQARTAWLAALAVHDDISHPEAPQVRDKLARLSDPDIPGIYLS